MDLTHQELDKKSNSSYFSSCKTRYIPCFQSIPSITSIPYVTPGYSIHIHVESIEHHMKYKDPNAQDRFSRNLHMEEFFDAKRNTLAVKLENENFWLYSYPQKHC